MNIRSAWRSEVDQLNRIAMEAKAHWGYGPEQMQAWKASLLTDADSIERWPTFVAEAQGHPVGFAQLNPEAKPWELVSLMVLPRYMGKGIGTALFQRACQAATQASQRSLVIDSDPNAQAFYLAAGAVVIGAVPAPIPGQPARVRPQLRVALDLA